MPYPAYFYTNFFKWWKTSIETSYFPSPSLLTPKINVQTAYRWAVKAGKVSRAVSWQIPWSALELWESKMLRNAGRKIFLREWLSGLRMPLFLPPSIHTINLMYLNASIVVLNTFDIRNAGATMWMNVFVSSMPNWFHRIHLHRCWDAKAPITRGFCIYNLSAT